MWPALRGFIAQRPVTVGSDVDRVRMKGAKGVSIGLFSRGRDANLAPLLDPIDGNRQRQIDFWHSCDVAFAPAMLHAAISPPGFCKRFPEASAEMMAIGRPPAGRSALVPGAAKLAAHLAIVLLSMPVAAAEPGTVKGRLTYDGIAYTLRHVYAWQPPLQGEELWIYLSDHALAPAAAQHGSLPEELARDKRFGGIKLVVHPAKPRLDDIKGVVYAPREDGFSLDKFNFGPSWQALAISERRVTGKLRTKWMSWTLEAEFSAPVEGATGVVRTITGLEAQSSPMADAFVAFEQALVEQGLDAAGAFMTPEKLAELRARIARLGEQSFREFQAARRESTLRGEARRRQIERVDIDGDHAQVGARSGPDAWHTALLVKTQGVWRVAEW